MADGMERRDFLKVLGAAGAGAGLLGCAPDGAQKLIPYVIPAEEIVPGMSTWYRTTCRECPAGCGMSVRTREGRALKAEGNENSPVSHGRLCPRGQASLHGLYNPDRVRRPLVREEDGDFREIDWEAALERVAAEVLRARDRGVLLTHPFPGTLDRFLDEWSEAAGMRRIRFDTFAWEPVRTASRMVYGIDGVPVHRFDQAEVVVTFGADFLETWVSPVDYHHGFVEARGFREGEGRRGRLVAVSPRQSLTDLNADEWLPARPGTEHLVALAMARLIVDDGAGQAGDAAALIGRVDPEAAAQVAGIPIQRIWQAARDFANGGRSLAVGPGVASTHREATAVAVAVAVLNQVAGNVGTTIDTQRLELGADAGSYQEYEELLDEMRAGRVESLFVYGPNPLHALPVTDEVLTAWDQVPFIASFSSVLDETAARSLYVLPDHHFLESWGDYSPRTGTRSLIQPVMTPVFDTRATPDVLLDLARRTGTALPTQAATYYDYLRERWQEDIQPMVAGAPGDFEDFWRQSLQAGVVDVAEPAPPTAAPDAAGLAGLRVEPAHFVGEDDDFYLIVYPSHRFYDGRLADRMWLQELPDPVAKISWTSWVEVNPETARQLGMVTGSVAEVETPYGEARLPVWIHPGIRPDAIAVQLGQGHEAMGRFARGQGHNAARLINPEAEQASGGLVWNQVRAALRPTRDWVRLPHTAGSETQAGRDIALAVTLEEARRLEPVPAMAAAAYAREEAPQAEPAPADGSDAQQAAYYDVHPHQARLRQLMGAGGFAPADVPASPGEWKPPGTNYGEYALEQPRWGMAIDLERCTGCSACIVACYAENNIGVVGPTEVARGRIQHWIRIERFFEENGDGEHSGTRFIPMLCQHCGTGPCEPVCPVYAAYHTPDGLNAQVYNRCVGTRYCANNCPYKVRYFNWFTWEWPEPLNWQLNPDVTVREKGVMEKCTFCVQRIRSREHQARLEGRPVVDGEIVPACAQTCPGDAIVFGNVRDPQSRAAQVAASGRGYRVLEELNTQSAIVYLKKVIADPAAEA